MSLEDTFTRAVAHISSSSVQASNDIKLELYAYYKIATVSTAPPNARPGMFDFAGRAKWDAWTRLGQTLSSSSSPSQTVSEAQKSYISIAKSKFGFNGEEEEPDAQAQATTGVMQEKGKQRMRDEDMTADELLDEPDESYQERNKGRGNARVAVSKMQLVQGNEESDEGAERNSDTTLHDLAAAGNTKGLAELRPSRDDLSRADEYVRDLLLRKALEVRLMFCVTQGFTPLHLAADRGHHHTVSLLLTLGADASIKDGEGYTALDNARIVDDQEMIAILEKA